MILLLIAAMLAPVAEAFDHWDTLPGLADDLEFQIAAVALMSGLFAAVALLVLRAAHPMRPELGPRVADAAEPCFALTLALTQADFSYPPLQLRI